MHDEYTAGQLGKACRRGLKPVCLERQGLELAGQSSWPMSPQTAPHLCIQANAKVVPEHASHFVWLHRWQGLLGGAGRLDGWGEWRMLEWAKCICNNPRAVVAADTHTALLHCMPHQMPQQTSHSANGLPCLVRAPVRRAAQESRRHLVL